MHMIEGTEKCFLIKFSFHSKEKCVLRWSWGGGWIVYTHVGELDFLFKSIYMMRCYDKLF